MTKTWPSLAQNYSVIATIFHSVAVLVCRQKSHILLPFTAMLCHPSSLVVSFSTCIHSIIDIIFNQYVAEMLSTHNARWSIKGEYHCHSRIRTVIWYFTGVYMLKDVAIMTCIRNSSNGYINPVVPAAYKLSTCFNQDLNCISLWSSPRQSDIAFRPGQ